MNEDDIIGLKIGHITVLEKTNKNSSDNKFLYKCICDCQNDLPEEEKKYLYRTKSNLMASYRKNANSTCGCRIGSNYGSWNKKENKYDLSGEYGIGWTENGYEFYFDLEDYILIKQYCWHKHQDGYLRTCYDYYKDDNGKRHNKYIMMHQLIGKNYNMNYIEIDHINGKPYDNRKENLRESEHVNNMKNVKLYSNNTSGHKGVCRGNKGWVAYINYDNNREYLGTFNNINDAIKVREQAEKEYFREFNRDEKYLVGV